MSKLLIVAGPTATGKTALGIALSKRLNGEIVSADSRHVYQGMDIGTGKDINKNSEFVPSGLKTKDAGLSLGYRLKDGIPVWLVDAVTPAYRFNLSDYTSLADIAINDISTRHKLPMVVGGTGLYIKALITPLEDIGIPVDKDLREKIETLDVSDLQEMLNSLNPKKLEKMNNSDRNNPRRLIRAIEIAKNPNKEMLPVNPDFVFIYLNMELKKIYERIDSRIKKRLKDGIVEEIETLLKNGNSFSMPSFSAIPYRLFKSYFNGNKSAKDLDKVVEVWQTEEHKLAKRQVTWFKKQLNELPKTSVVYVDAGIDFPIPELVGKLGKMV